MIRIFICLMVFVASYVYAQWSTNPYENLQVAEHGGNIHVATDENGGAIVAFNNFADVVKGYMQVIDKFGYLKWSEPKVILDGPGLKNYVWDIFHNPDGTILIGYTSGYTYVDPIPRFEYDPYVQKIDSNGNKLWGENGIRLRADSTGKRIYGMNFCYDGDGGIFAFWNFNYEVNYPPYFYDSLFIQHISKDGERLWGENGIFVDDNIIDALDSWIVDDDSSRIFVQYYKQTNVYYIKKFDSLGSLNWTLSLPNNYSRAIKDGNGGIIISGVIDSYPARKLIINRISPEGEKLWGNEVIVDDSVNNNLRYSAEIFLNPDSTVTVFWDTQWFPNDDLFLQRYTLEGEQVWLEHFKISEYNSNKTRLGIIESDNISNILVWSENRDTVGNYAQKIGQSGNKLWSEAKFIGAGTSSFNIITDGNGGAIAIWQKDPPWGGVYAQQISKYGNLGEIITTVIAEDKDINPGSFYLAQNYPNPFNSTTQIKYSVKENGFVVLKVYDVLGKAIATLINEEKQPGVYEVDFNASNLSDGKAGLSSGIYFYQMKAGDFKDTKKLIILK